MGIDTYSAFDHAIALPPVSNDPRVKNRKGGVIKHFQKLLLPDPGSIFLGKDSREKAGHDHEYGD